MWSVNERAARDPLKTQWRVPGEFLGKRLKSVYTPISLKGIYKVCPIENNTNLKSNLCIIKSSKINFIFLSAFYMIIWLMA